ncbi:hypothetical protein HMPREF9542_02062 [Escherichia coli MS 117-3]|nr:hypothetical protein HMPREF9542_02062 [Escherichia coli MS 117-3]
MQKQQKRIKTIKSGVCFPDKTVFIFIGVYRQHYDEENRIIKIRNYL